MICPQCQIDQQGTNFCTNCGLRLQDFHESLVTESKLLKDTLGKIPLTQFTSSETPLDEKERFLFEAIQNTEESRAQKFGVLTVLLNVVAVIAVMLLTIIILS